MAPTRPTPAETARDILKTLRAKADPVKAAGGQAYFKETVLMFGWRAADLHALGRETFRSVKPSWSCADAVALCDLLYTEPQLEAKAVATLVLLGFRRDFPASMLDRIHGWLAADRLANWASVDVLCPDAMATLLPRFPGLAARIRDWAGHPNRWVKRASAVSFIKLARKGQFLDDAYEIAGRLFSVDDDLVQKANGWMLREAGKTDAKRLERFLLEHGARIPRTTLRYAIEKFPPARRRMLMAKTR